MSHLITKEQANKEKKRERIVYIVSAVGVGLSAIPYVIGGFIYFRSNEYREMANMMFGCGHGTLIMSVITASANKALGRFIYSNPVKNSQVDWKTKTLETKVEIKSNVEKEKTNLETKVEKVDSEKIAEQFINAEKVVDRYNTKREAVDIEWKGENYGGFIQKVAPEYSEDILFLWKTKYPSDKKFLEFYEVVKKVNEEKKLGLKRECLVADDNLDLSRWEHFVKRVGDRLVTLSEEERVYVENNKDAINKILLNYPLKGTPNEST